MRAVHDERIADLARVESLLESRVAGVEAAHEADAHEPAAERRLGLDDAQARLGVRSQRLLAEHRLAGVEARERELLVRGRRRRDDHRLDVAVADELVRVRVDRRDAVLGRDTLGGLRECVADGGDPRTGYGSAENADVGGAHQAGTDDADVHSLAPQDAVGKCRCAPSGAWSGQRVVTAFARV